MFLKIHIWCLIFDDLKLSADAKGSDIGSSSDIHPNELHETNGRLNSDVSVDVACDISRSRPGIQKVQGKSEAVDYTSSLNKKDNFYETRPVSRKKSHNRIEKVGSARKYSKGKTDVLAEAKPHKNGNQNSRRSGDSAEMSIPDQFFSVDYEGEMNALGHGRTTSEPSSASAAMSSSTTLLPSKANSKPKVLQASSSGLKTSVQKVVQHFRPPKSSKLSQPSSSINEVTKKYDCKFKVFCTMIISTAIIPY